MDFRKFLYIWELQALELLFSRKFEENLIVWHVLKVGTCANNFFCLASYGVFKHKAWELHERSSKFIFCSASWRPSNEILCLNNFKVIILSQIILFAPYSINKICVWLQAHKFYNFNLMFITTLPDFFVYGFHWCCVLSNFIFNPLRAWIIFLQFPFLFHQILRNLP
jgi:hypothetical protein